MTPVEVLRQARDLWLAHPTKHEFARDENGDSVEPMDPTAVCWCAYGAMAKVLRSGGLDVMGTKGAEALRQTFSQADGTLLTSANDDGTLTREHWDAAIRSLGGDP